MLASFPSPSYARAWSKLGWPALNWSAVARGGVIIAAADLLLCLAYWSPLGVPPQRLLQGVAAGALGADAFTLGWTAAVLGAGFQWLIGAGFVVAYAVAATRLPVLDRQWLGHGLVYGLVLDVVMTRVVVPLSAAPQSAHPDPVWALICVPMFMLFGVLAAGYGARAARVRTMR